MITGTTRLIAHLGYPTGSFKAPMIYNPYFEREGIDAVVVPMGCGAEDYPAFLRLVFRLSNTLGALVTMPHKVTTAGLVDTLLPTAAIAGACNAVRREPDGRLTGEMFDGEGFVRGLLRKGRRIAGRRALVLGAGGVGSAIAASLAKAGVGALGLYDIDAAAAEALALRLAHFHPALGLSLGSNDPAGFDIVVNATPLGMRPGDPLPLDVARLDAASFVGEVVMAEEITPFLAAARARGCAVQVGKDMLFEQIPAYLEFFDLPSTTAEDLRSVARLD
ncbi:shikimate dehydrogenase family protein [Bosea sp. (in: a-proteobacteria)]